MLKLSVDEPLISFSYSIEERAYRSIDNYEGNYQSHNSYQSRDKSRNKNYNNNKKGRNEEEYDSPMRSLKATMRDQLSKSRGNFN